MFKIEASYEFDFEGLSNFSPSVEGMVRQSKNIEIKYKTHIKRVHDVCDTCFQYNVKNHESTI